jgi:hypothetical protein
VDGYKARLLFFKSGSVPLDGYGGEEKGGIQGGVIASGVAWAKSSYEGSSPVVMIVTYDVGR